VIAAAITVRPASGPGGHTLAVGSQDNKIRLWDVIDPARPRPADSPFISGTGSGPNGGMNSVAFSPDGHPESSKRVARVFAAWSSKAGIPGPAAPVNSPALSAIVGRVQDRYAGDLGDHLKFGLLRWLVPQGSPASPRLGVVWYRPVNEAHNADGKHAAYPAARPPVSGPPAPGGPGPVSACHGPPPAGPHIDLIRRPITDRVGQPGSVHIGCTRGCGPLVDHVLRSASAVEAHGPRLRTGTTGSVRSERLRCERVTLIQVSAAACRGPCGWRAAWRRS
jgi:hypothetical protein